MEENKKLTAEELGKLGSEAVEQVENRERSFKYEHFIDALSRGALKEMSFSVKGYGHYKNCSVVCEKAITKDGKIITVTLAKNEGCTFYGNINESAKLFNIKGKGTFTFKEMWDKLEIKEIVRS